MVKKYFHETVSSLSTSPNFHRLFLRIGHSTFSMLQSVLNSNKHVILVEKTNIYLVITLIEKHKHMF